MMLCWLVAGLHTSLTLYTDGDMEVLGVGELLPTRLGGAECLAGAVLSGVDDLDVAPSLLA